MDAAYRHLRDVEIHRRTGLSADDGTVKRAFDGAFTPMMQFVLDAEELSALGQGLVAPQSWSGGSANMCAHLGVSQV